MPLSKPAALSEKIRHEKINLKAVIEKAIRYIKKEHLQETPSPAP